MVSVLNPTAAERRSRLRANTRISLSPEIVRLAFVDSSAPASEMQTREGSGNEGE